ncbi:hypothetical protein J1N35_028398 [Gossypium stocksii]|uniref:Uncharacterized protein n=1 Tax=Gossypium stocksii TaxID=47602 RepID=A0A9D3ZR29_9ROSI|nr:hypothetical protein J1N35_028398 [Gossypium stocksii]
MKVILAGLLFNFYAVVSSTSISSEPVPFEWLVKALIECENRQLWAIQEVVMHTNLVEEASSQARDGSVYDGRPSSGGRLTENLMGYDKVIGRLLIFPLATGIEVPSWLCFCCITRRLGWRRWIAFSENEVHLPASDAQVSEAEKTEVMLTGIPFDFEVVVSSTSISSELVPFEWFNRDFDRLRQGDWSAADIPLSLPVSRFPHGSIFVTSEGDLAEEDGWPSQRMKFTYLPPAGYNSQPNSPMPGQGLYAGPNSPYVDRHAYMLHACGPSRLNVISRPNISGNLDGLSRPGHFVSARPTNNCVQLGPALGQDYNLGPLNNDAFGATTPPVP